MAGGVIKQEAGSHRRRRSRGRAQPMAEINITPFVDVMLVLLIIFMVAAPLMTVGVPVELPDTAARALPTEAEEPLTVTLTADGGVMIQTTPVPEAELVARLQAIAAERQRGGAGAGAGGGAGSGAADGSAGPAGEAAGGAGGAGRIYLRADGANAWERVAQVMGALSAAGFSNIGLVTEPGGPTLGQDAPDGPATGAADPASAG